MGKGSFPERNREDFDNRGEIRGKPYENQSNESSDGEKNSEKPTSGKV